MWRCDYPCVNGCPVLSIKSLLNPVEFGLVRLAADGDDIESSWQSLIFRVCFQKILSGANNFPLFVGVNAGSSAAKTCGMSITDFDKYEAYFVRPGLHHNQIDFAHSAAVVALQKLQTRILQ